MRGLEERTDAPEPIQITPHDYVLPEILIEQVMLSNFGRPRGCVRSTDAVGHADAAHTIGGAGHAIKLGSLGLDRRFLGDASAGGGRGGERTVARDGCVALEALQCGGEREGLAFGEELALAIEPLDICNGEGMKTVGMAEGRSGRTGVFEECEKRELGGMCGHADEEEGIAPHDEGETIESSIPYQNINTISGSYGIPFPPHHNKAT